MQLIEMMDLPRVELDGAYVLFNAAKNVTVHIGGRNYDTLILEIMLKSVAPPYSCLCLGPARLVSAVRREGKIGTNLSNAS